MNKVVKAVGNVVVTYIAAVGGIIFMAIVAWQNRGKQKE